MPTYEFRRSQKVAVHAPDLPAALRAARDLDIQDDAKWETVLRYPTNLIGGMTAEPIEVDDHYHDYCAEEVARLAAEERDAVWVGDAA